MEGVWDEGFVVECNCWHEKEIGVLSGGGETIDSGVRGGINSGGLGYVSHSVFEVHLLQKVREEGESS